MPEANKSGVQPYLFFRGRCEEAIDYYKERLDADVVMMMRFKDCPEQPEGDDDRAAEFAEKIMHASLRINGADVMMSDGMKSGEPEFDSVSLSLAMPDAQTAQRYFDALAQDGKVEMPIGATFFSPCFGMVKDKFGLSWMVIVDPDEAPA